MNKQELVKAIKAKGSFLCVGLDPVMEKLPVHLQDHEDALFVFCKEIIDATLDYCVAYKPNTAFFEQYGVKGWDALARVIAYIPETHLCIADAKRGDIGNTSKAYANAFFNDLKADALTVAPYMGEDSVVPFVQDGKWVVVLGLTSNKGSLDFQHVKTESGQLISELVVSKVCKWVDSEHAMFVVGATRGEEIAKVRAIAKDYFFLVPGVGAQGGSLEEVVKYGMTDEVGLLVNSSRGIIYASSGEDFAKEAGSAAKNLARQMKAFLD